MSLLRKVDGALHAQASRPGPTKLGEIAGCIYSGIGAGAVATGAWTYFEPRTEPWTLVAAGAIWAGLGFWLIHRYRAKPTPEAAA